MLRVFYLKGGYYIVMSAINALLPCISALLAEASDDLSATSDSPRLDAELLLAFVLQVPRSYLFAHPEEQPGTEAFAIFRDLVNRRKGGEPVAYITGVREFWSLDLTVNRHTLVPRPDTETLVATALDLIADCRKPDIADLGTGSGAIALALACERPDANIVATDASEEAIALARFNCTRLEIINVDFICGNWFDAVPGRKFDLVVSNPPYVAVDDPHLRSADIRYEPINALAAGSDGLDSIRQIVAAAPSYLRPGGWIALEHGDRQGHAVTSLLTAAGFGQVATVNDHGGRERVGYGRAARNGI